MMFFILATPKTEIWVGCYTIEVVGDNYIKYFTVLFDATLFLILLMQPYPVTR